MKTFITLLNCLFFLLPFQLRSQDLIKEGFIVLDNGDTLSGEIRSKNWDRTPRIILFRGKNEENFSEYDTYNVGYFEAGEDRYLRVEVWVDHRPVNHLLDPDAMLPEHSIRLEEETVFLKCLVLGTKYDLLELVDGNKTHYYLRDRAGIIIPLEYKVSLINQDKVAISYKFRETLTIINFQEKNDPLIKMAIKEAYYFGSSLAEIVEAINNSTGSVFYSAIEQKRKKITFFAGAAAGITVSMPSGNTYLKAGTGSIAGIIGGFDLNMGYSCNGGETTFRFDVLIARILYAANASEPSKHRIHESLQYGIIPSVQIRFPLFTLENLQSHIGGGFKTPIHLSEQEKINRWKYSSSDDRFPWVAITIGGQIDFQIRKRWEIGLAAYQAPSVSFTDNYEEPIHYYLWLAYRFK